MTGVSFETMAERGRKELQKLKENTEYANINENTKNWVAVWSTLVELKEMTQLLIYKAKQLDKVFRRALFTRLRRRWREQTSTVKCFPCCGKHVNGNRKKA